MCLGPDFPGVRTQGQGNRMSVIKKVFRLTTRNRCCVKLAFAVPPRA